MTSYYILSDLPQREDTDLRLYAKLQQEQSDADNAAISAISYHDDVATDRVQGEEERTRKRVLARFSPDDFAD